jgi:hypothetical protein
VLGARSGVATPAGSFSGLAEFTKLQSLSASDWLFSNRVRPVNIGLQHIERVSQITNVA